MAENILSKNLDQLMRMHGNISVSDLARFTSIPQPTLHHILAGTTLNPRKKSLEALATFFSISINQLLGNESLPNTIPEYIKTNLNINSVPIIEWNMLLDWPINVQKLNLKEIFLNRKISSNSFALKMQDKSMEPLQPKDSILIFEHEKKVNDRDFVIAHFKKENTILFNRLFLDGNYTYIKQNLSDGNAKLKNFDKVIDRIVGILVEVRIEY